MSIKGHSLLSLGLACAAIAALPVAQAPASADIAAVSGRPASASPAQALASFQALNRQSSIYRRDDGTIGRVYGAAFSHGNTPAASAQSFLNQHLSMWGVPANQLVAEGPFDDGHHTQQIGYLPDFNDYKFTGHYYKQIVDGLPVFRSKLVLLTRNEENNPLVLASAELRQIGDFQVEPQLRRQAINHNRIVQSAEKHFNLGVVLDSTERLIYAGVENAPHAPTLADASTVIVNGFEKHLVITDAATGQVLFTESLIHTLDIAGNVSALGSDGPAADICAAEISQPLPYLFVNGPSGSATTDINGNYTLSNPGSSAVNVSAGLAGQWFRVLDFVGSVESISQSVTPPGPGNFVFNASNATENNRAEVNAYLGANVVRDSAIAANPSYPGLNFQMDVTVNRTDGFCPGNAWYDPADQSINFCSTGGGSPNTAWTSVIYHEYGHHLVNVGGSGQGQYGEGMGDVMSVILLDDHRLGIGFFGSCSSWLRDAEDGLQYPCGTDGHACAPLISGCAWDTRNEMVLNGVSDYTDVLNFLAVNSILVHSGSTITPQITIDWLTLDDDDADIGNGTPHYNEIAAGFGAHNMDAPALNLYSISFPEGRPERVSPDGGSSMLVNFSTISVPVDPSSATLMVDTGSGYQPVAMTQNSATEFEAVFPAADCGSQISYYITSQSSGGATQNSPSGAPGDGSYSTTAAYSAPMVAFDDNFQADLGWTVSGSATDGQWNRDVPLASCAFRGSPGADFDGSGSCYLTDNSANPANDCNSDVDGGVTILTSPIMDASGGNTSISYARWYDNTFGDAPMADTMIVEVSDDAGASWVNLETVGPAGAEVSGGWYTKEFSLNDVPGFLPTSQVMIRFSVADAGSGSVIEAGVDAVKLNRFDCTGNPCPADLDANGELDFFDISAFITLYTEGDPAADFSDDGQLDFFDISAFVTAYSAGCP